MYTPPLVRSFSPRLNRARPILRQVLSHGKYPTKVGPANSGG